ncbi:MAG: DUF1566 domain-containing protein, partial [Candidatus Electrothrix sp. AX1]|nr:DUF1566 domain-containing protein [Candidatus Electrothrix sp. AX1]
GSADDGGKDGSADDGGKDGSADDGGKDGSADDGGKDGSDDDGGKDGSADDGGVCYGYNSDDSSTFCNTEAYVNRVNTAGLCGANDWRMPTRMELRSLIHYGRYNPAIDTNYFPNALSSDVWSGSPFADDSGKAWYVGFYYGSSDADGRRNNFVRLVRSKQ